MKTWSPKRLRLCLESRKRVASFRWICDVSSLSMIIYCSSKWQKTAEKVIRQKPSIPSMMIWLVTWFVCQVKPESERKWSSHQYSGFFHGIGADWDHGLDQSDRLFNSRVPSMAWLTEDIYNQTHQSEAKAIEHNDESWQTTIGSTPTRGNWKNWRKDFGNSYSRLNHRMYATRSGTKTNHWTA